MKRILLTGCLLLLLSAGATYGQGCSVCTQTAKGLDDKSARGLNGGILYLAFLPLTIMCTVGYFWWRGNKSS